MNVGVICLLSECKAALVDSVVHSVVHPLVHGLNVFLFVARKKRFGDLAQGWINKGIEGSVEHANNLRGLVIDNGLMLAIPQSGDCIASLVSRVGFMIELGVFCEAIKRVAWLGTF